VGDLQQFRQGVVTMLGAPPGPLQDAAVTFTRQCFEPIFASPFRVTSQYVASLVETFKTMALSSRKLKDDEFFTMPRDMLFINRLQFGFYSVLARLNASVDYAQVERGFVPHLSLTTP
jgi:hypothetical protein